jgi:hypothetical protein
MRPVAMFDDDQIMIESEKDTANNIWHWFDKMDQAAIGYTWALI